MDVSTYLRAVRAHWLLIVALTVVGTVAGVVLVLTATPLYQAKVTFFVTTPSTSGGSPLQGDQFGQQRVNTYVKLLGSERLADRVVTQEGVELTTEEVTNSIEGTADLNTVLLTATITQPSPEEALALATGVAAQFPDLVEEIESVDGTKEAPVGLDVVSGPTVSSDPVSPKTKLTIGAGVLLGLTAGLGAAIAWSVLDRSVRTVEALEQATAAPVLGTIPFEETAGGSALILGGQAGHARSEAYRHLRTNLKFVDAERPVEVLVVTSSGAGEGKSSTSTNLALTFAGAGKKVLLIDADLRRPTVGEVLGLESAAGLSNVLAGQVDVQDVLQRFGSTQLTVLTSGSTPPNPSELLDSHQMSSLISAMRAKFDLVVIDTPPVLPVTDAAIVSTKADGAIVVVRYGKTRTTDAKAALDSLRAVDARVLGTVLNRMPYQRKSYSDRYGLYESAQDGVVAKEQPRTMEKVRANLR